MLKIRYQHILLALMVCLVSSVNSRSSEPVITQGTASIQATARVEPSLGLTDARMIELESMIAALNYEPGSHLFWLYCPKLSGVTVSIESLSQDFKSDPDMANLQVLQEYQYASLVRLDQKLVASDTASGDVLITIIYTDN